MYSDLNFSSKKEATPRQNRVRVLQLIRDKKEITRADIIKQTGLSAPTISRIIDALISRKIIVQEELGESSGGRPPQIIRFESKRNYVIGIDIGGSYVRAAFSNLDGEFLYEIHLPIEPSLDFLMVIDQVGELIQKLLNRANLKQKKVFGIGVAVCGIVNKRTGRVDYSPVLDWKYVDIKEALKKFTDLPVSVGNVANLIAQGELHYGIGKRYSDFITINLEYGIGSGIILNRQAFLGSQGYSGEIGHIVVNPNIDEKGKKHISGTLEAFASSYAITERLKELIENGSASNLASKVDSLTIQSILKASQNGDILSKQVLDSAIEYIGISIDTLVKVFNPEAIVLSGGLSTNEEYFIKKIREKVRSISLPLYDRDIPILVSTFGEDASLMGAFSLILNEILQLEY